MLSLVLTTGAALGTWSSAGSCYSMTTHVVTCNVAEADCNDNWYAENYKSGRSGCCHCQAGCDNVGAAGMEDCSYYDTAPPPPSAAEDPCFPNTATVTLAGGKQTTVDQLKEGDAIVAMTADGAMTTDTVSLLSIAKPAAEATFVTLTTDSQSLTVTGTHHLPFGEACCSLVKQAKDFAVGDKVWSVVDNKAAASTITATGTAVAKGLHSPVLTNGGFPVVDGVATSFDDFETVSLASKTLKYLLPLCKATGSCGLFRRTFLHADRQYIDEA